MSYHLISMKKGTIDEEQNNRVGSIVDLAENSALFMSYEQTRIRDELYRVTPDSIKVHIYSILMPVLNVSDEDIDNLRDYNYVKIYGSYDEYITEFHKIMLMLFAVGIQYYEPNIKIDSKGFYTPSGFLNFSKNRLSLSKVDSLFKKYQTTDKFKMIMKLFNERLGDTIN